MHNIKFADKNLVCQPDETLLQAFLRENIEIPNSCHQGSCQSCLMQSLDNPPPTSAQNGLKDSLQAQNYFLACLCRPEQSMTVALPDSSNDLFVAHVVKKEPLNSDIVRLVMQCQSDFAFFAGQFVNIQHPVSGVSRSYSIANVPKQDNQIEFHIRRLNNGYFSNWVHDDLTAGTELQISSAKGSCHYVPGKAQQPMLFIGTGSGLAPLYSIIQDALNQGHQGDIHLYHGSTVVDGLYLVQELRAMTVEFSNFHYHPCVSSELDTPDIRFGRANDVALQEISDLRNWRVYLCGHPEMVKQTKRSAYLNGASLKDIYADPFYVSQPNS